VAFDLVEGCLVFAEQAEQFEPEVFVLHGLLFVVLPAIFLPLFIPFLVDAVDQVGAVRVDFDFYVRFFELLQRLDAGGQLHALVGGVVLAAPDFLDCVLIFEHGAPAAPVAAELVAGAGAITIYDNFVLGHGVPLLV